MSEKRSQRTGVATRELPGKERDGSRIGRRGLGCQGVWSNETAPQTLVAQSAKNKKASAATQASFVY